MPLASAAEPFVGYLSHAASVAALPPDTREFFLAHGYTLARLARRNRVSRQMMQAFFGRRAVSRRLVRNLAKLRVQLEARANLAQLRAQLDARAPEGAAHAATP